MGAGQNEFVKDLKPRVLDPELSVLLPWFWRHLSNSISKPLRYIWCSKQVRSCKRKGGKLFRTPAGL